MNDSLSQEEIDKMLTGTAENSEPAKKFQYLTEVEADAIGEIGNISMGSAATTLSLLLGNKVDITTPTIQEYSLITDMFQHVGEFVTVEIKYKLGLQGTTVFSLDKKDVLIIADLMMGGEGKIDDTQEVSELQLSAVGEAMNQMIGTASTSMSSMFNTNIDITPPEVKLQNSEEKLKLADDVVEVPIVAVNFRLTVGDLIDSTIVQVMSLESAKGQVERLMNIMMAQTESLSAPANQESAKPVQQAPQAVNVQHQAPPMQETQKPITVQPVQFASFDESHEVYGESNKNLNILMDIKLTLTVELGRTELPIKKVLELTRGSVIELDKIAGEPVELYANGKLVAKGEVVVIEDNFGLRITNIISPEHRLKNI